MATIINTLEVIVEPPTPIGPPAATPPPPESAPSPMLLEDVRERAAWLRLRVFAH
jgi:hypothetical protein